MNFSRLLKTIFLIEFIVGLYMAIKELFRKSKTINYPFEKGSISPRMRENMHEDILLAKKMHCMQTIRSSMSTQAITVSPQNGQMVVGKRHDMTLICLNVFIGLCRKYQWTQLCKDLTLNLRLKLKSFITIKKNS